MSGDLVDRGGEVVLSVNGARAVRYPLLTTYLHPTSLAMRATRCLAAKKNLLVCLDAFGTLFKPSVPIPVAYADAAAQHGIDCGDMKKAQLEVGARFKDAFKDESTRNPNYGRATGLGAENWWGNVSVVTGTIDLNMLSNCNVMIVQE